MRPPVFLISLAASCTHCASPLLFTHVPHGLLTSKKRSKHDAQASSRSEILKTRLIPLCAWVVGLYAAAELAATQQLMSSALNLSTALAAFGLLLLALPVSHEDELSGRYASLISAGAGLWLISLPSLERLHPWLGWLHGGASVALAWAVVEHAVLDNPASLRRLTTTRSRRMLLFAVLSLAFVALHILLYASRIRGSITALWQLLQQSTQRLLVIGAAIALVLRLRCLPRLFEAKARAAHDWVIGALLLWLLLQLPRALSAELQRDLGWQWASLVGACLLVLGIFASGYPALLVHAPRLRAMMSLGLGSRRPSLSAAFEQATQSLSTLSDLLDIGPRAMHPIRQALRDPQISPVLYLSDPDRAFALDAAGQLRPYSGQLAAELVDYCLNHPDRPIGLPPIKAGLSSQSSERIQVQAWLEAQHCLCLVPLVHQGELEGIVCLPQGRWGRQPLRYDEERVLKQLMIVLAARLSVLNALERSRDRQTRTHAQEQVLMQRVQSLQQELRSAQMRCEMTEAWQVRATLSMPWVSYSPAMQTLEQSISVWLQDPSQPVWLVAQQGTALGPLWTYLKTHAQQRSICMSIAQVDVAEIDPGCLDTLLFGSAQGEPQSPSWLTMSANTILVLHHPERLPLASAERLARWLRDKGQAGPRIVAVSQAALQRHVDARALDASLGPCFNVHWQMPPLRERREDLESLCLHALAQACRTQGKGPLGFDPEALRWLLSYPWPGNDAELHWRIHHAVAAVTKGQVVTLGHLDAQAGGLSD